MGDIRELWIAIAIIIFGLASSIMAVAKLQFLHELHPIILLVLVIAGTCGIFVGTIYAWAGTAKLVHSIRQARNKTDTSRKTRSKVDKP